jgi:hypothetical protein
MQNKKKGKRGGGGGGGGGGGVGDSPSQSPIIYVPND